MTSKRRCGFALRTPAFLGLAVGEAYANTVVVAFSAFDEVPLSPWTALLIAISLLLLAQFTLKRSLPKSLWPLSALLALGLVGQQVVDVWFPDAKATPTTLASTFDIAFPSPMTSPQLLVGDQDISAINATGRTIRIESINATVSLFFHLYPPTKSPECKLGVILADGQSCYFKLGAST